jgi:hypothetical protein
MRSTAYPSRKDIEEARRLALENALIRKQERTASRELARRIINTSVARSNQGGDDGDITLRPQRANLLADR